MQTIELPCYGITVFLDSKGGGTVTSSCLRFGLSSSNFEAALDAIESLILAHACAGIDIQTPAYVEGIETAIDAVFNIYS